MTRNTYEVVTQVLEWIEDLIMPLYAAAFPPRLYTYTPCYSLYPALLFIASAKMEIGHHESAVSLRNAHWGMKDPLCLVT